MQNTSFALQGVLKWLGCELDTVRNLFWCGRIRQSITMGETEKGHYAIPVMPPHESGDGTGRCV